MLSLNEEQNEAVEHFEGPLLVLAGAGAGKTRIVTARIARLIERGVPSSSILAVTFTNKAAGEMVERVNTLSSQRVPISTFHSLGARILRESATALGYQSNFVIYDEDDTNKLIKGCLDELKINSRDLKPKQFRPLISQAKNDFLSPDEVVTPYSRSERDLLFPDVYRLYQQKLKEYNAFDFDDLLYLTVRLFRECPEELAKYQDRWSFVLIDEYQDINQAQYLIAKSLVEKSNNLFVVGDPDQSIYSWRGANIQNILNFEADYPGAKVVYLEQNYRSHNTILEAANALIQNNESRYEKNLWSSRGEGDPIRLVEAESDREEANTVIDAVAHEYQQGTPLNEIAILYRTNAQSRQFEDLLLRHRIPYVIVGGISFYQRREIKDILGFLRMVEAGTDYLSFARTINLPKRGIGGVTLDKLRVGATEAGLSIFDFCQQTVHGGNSLSLSKKQREGLTSYVELINDLRQTKENSSLMTLVSQAVRQSGYLNVLKGDEETFDDRKENLNQLIAKAAEWEESTDLPSLQGFLEELSLKSSLDEAGDDEKIRLMTLHNAKGLEFDVVYLVGMEEGLFPHANSRGKEDAIEEERRLCYVGMTRAKERLTISACRYRYLWGEAQFMRPSRFLQEIPPEYCKARGSKASSATETIAIGDEVFHSDFGTGTVEDMYEGSLGLIYKIFFNRDHSTKTLVAKYSQLVKN